MGWTPPHIKQWKSVLKLEIRMKSMEATRLNSKVYIWAKGKGGNNCRNWTFRLKQHMRKCNFSNDNLISNRTVKELEERMFNVFKGEWKEKVESDQGGRPNQRNKLRTYRLFKHEYCTEPYVKEVINRQHRSALAKFRCGVAPLKIETGRYERIPHDQRFCFNCANKVEDEIHVLTECPLYDDLRQVLYQKAADSSGTFIHLSGNEKMCFVLSKRGNIENICQNLL